MSRMFSISRGESVMWLIMFWNTTSSIKITVSGLVRAIVVCLCKTLKLWPIHHCCSKVQSLIHPALFTPGLQKLHAEFVCISRAHSVTTCQQETRSVLYQIFKLWSNSTTAWVESHHVGCLPVEVLFPDNMSLLTKFTMALAGWSAFSSANTWHWLQARLAGFLATKAKSRLERCRGLIL